MTLGFHTLDVFTDRPFAGNPLAVVLGADGLSAAQMQTIAREFNLSETIFVMAPRDRANTARVRIFFPTAEIPFAGHPTIGCAILLATRGRGPGDFTTAITLEEEAGLVPVTVVRQGALCEAEFTAPVLPHAAPGKAPPDLIASALDLPIRAVGPHRPAVWQGGPRFLFVPLADPGALRAARPIEPHWSRLMGLAGVDSAYLYVAASRDELRARMFSPTAGIPEDPATGSAAAILAAQLLATGALAEGQSRWRILQGVEMGRPSTLHLTVDVADGRLARVRIRGAAVTVAEGRIAIPSP